MATRARWVDRIRKRPLYALLAAVAVAITAWAFRPRPMAVEAARLERGPVTVAFVEEGRTRLRERYVVSAPLGGVLERIEREPGDAVAAGERVVSIRAPRASLLDPATGEEARARWRVAAGDRAAAVAALAAARAVERDRSTALARAARLAEDRLVARGEVDALRAAVDVARADVRAATARVAAARVQERAAGAVLGLQGGAGVTRIALEAPVGGRIIRRNVESETFVAPGQPVLEIGDARDLEVVVDVLSSDAVRIGPGTRVELLDWGGGGALAAYVVRVEPGAFVKVSALGVEERRVPVVIRFAEPPPASLGDGFRVDARFLVWRASVPSLPVAALFRDGDQWAVYAIEDGRARLRRVRIGQIGEDRAQVLGGLPDGAVAILYPGDSVRDGRRVAVGRWAAGP